LRRFTPEAAGIELLHERGTLLKGSKRLIVTMFGLEDKEPPRTTTSPRRPDIIEEILNRDKTHLYLKINLTVPKNTIIRGMRLLFKRYCPPSPKIKLTKAGYRVSQWSLIVWKGYLKCYDLRESGYTLGEIGQLVYPNVNRSRERANKAIARVTTLIELAENRKPPFPSIPG
jgi:hypothetical protein